MASPPPEESQQGNQDRPSFLRRWFSWLMPRPEPANQTAADAVFSELAQEGGDNWGTPLVLRPSRSKPTSPLAAAYAQPTPAQDAQAPPPAQAQNPAAARWQNREPADASDPVPHQECLAVRRGENWTLLGASVRGRLHAHQALYRDDSFAWSAAGDWTCLAVGDGAGSAPLSRVGSRLACVAAVTTLAEALNGWQPGNGEAALTREEGQRLRTALASAGQAARAAIAAEAERRGQPLQNFHTTLLVAAHLPGPGADLVAALQVGDGTVALHREPGVCEVLGEADHGGYASETRFLTTPGIEDELEARVCLGRQAGLRALALMSDGVADDFFPEAERLVDLFEGDPVRDLLDPQGGPVRGLERAVLPDPRDGLALVDWLGYQKRGSSDDRTLLVLHRTATKEDAAP